MFIKNNSYKHFTDKRIKNSNILNIILYYLIIKIYIYKTLYKIEYYENF